jgi:hypothetical protein
MFLFPPNWRAGDDQIKILSLCQHSIDTKVLQMIWDSINFKSPHKFIRISTIMILYHFKSLNLKDNPVSPILYLFDVNKSINMYNIKC